VPGPRLLIALLVIFVAAVVPAVIGPTLLCRTEDPVLERYGALPPFKLVDESGAEVTEDALRGHPTIIDFIFTRCESICPTLSLRMQRIAERTADKRGLPIKLLSISVDPQYDTPARLRTYAERFGADPRRWKFVTGDPAQIKALVEGPLMSSMLLEGLTTSGAPNISHSGYFFLVDAQLEIRGMYDSNDNQALDRMLHDARFLARTATKGYKFGGGD
jgi:protein SCO1